MMNRTRALIALAVLAAAAAFSSSASPALARDPLAQDKGTGSFLIAFNEEVTESEARAVARLSGLVGGLWMPALQTLAVTTGSTGLDLATASMIESRSDVRFVEANPALSATTAPNDTSYAQQWAPGVIGAEAAWEVTTGSSGIVVAVLDSGLNLEHAEFVGKTVPGWDFYNNDSNPSDDNGHGTHVAGVVGALTNNAQGIASIGRQTTIMPVKVLSKYAGGNHATAAAGIVWAVDNGARIINLSLGSIATSATLESAVNYAYNNGVLVVAAAGNGNASTPFYPAAYVNALAIGATDSADARYSMSNFGSWLDMMGPGVSIHSTNWPSAYNTRTGTSQATPHVSAVAALMLAIDSALTVPELRDGLQTTAHDLGAAGFDNNFGFGRLDAAAAVASIGGVVLAEATPTDLLPPTATAEPPTATAEPPTATPTPSPTAAPQAPVISGVGASPVQNTWARINWTTDIGASSQVEYGRTMGYGSMTTFGDSEITEHAEDVVGLRRHTTYHYRVLSIANGVATISADYTFLTQ